MRNIVALLIIGLAGYGAWHWWQERSQKIEPAPVTETPAVPAAPAAEKPQRTDTVSVTSPSLFLSKPVSPEKVNLPEGVFLVTQPASITTDSGIVGIRAGARVNLVKDNGESLRVSDGRQEFDIARTSVTNDPGEIADFYDAQQKQAALSRPGAGARRNAPNLPPPAAQSQPAPGPASQPNPQRQIDDSALRQRLTALARDESVLRGQISEGYAEQARENDARLRGRVFSKGQYAGQLPALQERLDANQREQGRIRGELSNR